MSNKDFLALAPKWQAEWLGLVVIVGAHIMVGWLGFIGSWGSEVIGKMFGANGWCGS